MNQLAAHCRRSKLLECIPLITLTRANSYFLDLIDGYRRRPP